MVSHLLVKKEIPLKFIGKGDVYYVILSQFSILSMKKEALLIICLLTTGIAVLAQHPAPVPAASGTTAPAVQDDVLQLKEPSHQFGKIPQGRPVTYSFEILNSGPAPLYLENVQASCGCTTPEWSREPIAPGATAQIKVGYNAYAEGHFAKTVTIFYNNGKTKLITIQGDVYKLPPSSAPENASVQFLKQTNQ
jgi:Protein of unknown function (DUF1573)